MDQCNRRSNIRFLTAGLSANAAFGALIYAAAGAVGGESYYNNVLMGGNTTPMLIASAIVGAVAAFALRDKAAT